MREVDEIFVPRICTLPERTIGAKGRVLFKVILRLGDS